MRALGSRCGLEGREAVLNDVTLRVGDRFPVEALSVQPTGPAIVYFYPQDNTQGCTLEAVGFNRLYDRFQEASVDVIGVSVDSNESHRRFTGDHRLRFPLVADPEGALTARLGLMKDYGEYGRLAARVTFLLDREGIVRRIWRVQDIAAHPEETLAAARELMAEEAA